MQRVGEGGEAAGEPGGGGGGNVSVGMEADRVMQWLNRKELRSVVFVSLAMMAHGLELSGAAFVHRAGGGTFMGEDFYYWR
uniref:Uncharacterized protein n=1 Tax=Oryza barthii TaxID=65489 RepID=A0A0D3GRE1_9ORYZ